MSKIINKKTFITLDEYKTFSNEEISHLINKKLEFIQTHDFKDYFTDLFSDYLNFLQEFDSNKLDNAIKISQEFKNKIFDL